MDPIAVLTAVLTLGVGGVVGALAAAALSTARMKLAYESFKASFRLYFAGKTDPESVEMVATFDALTEEVERATSAFERLKRALKRR